ncbi:MAG: hypothetical protein H8D67_31025 [Deltaproteobacteria bacterium]|nr:hypothetical protein [Deltaproteobacteria bacterium]
MSVSYYRLRPPITYLKLEKSKGHDKLFVWVNHQLVGRLTLDKHDTRQVIDCFTLFEPGDECPLRSYWGGAEKGTVVYANEISLPRGMIVISEYGELFTVAQVFARHGANRKDGLPTELGGFEEEK